MATVSDSALVPKPSPPSAADVGWKTLAPGVKINEAAWTPAAERILTPSALELVARLHRELQEERRRLLGSRVERQEALDRGALPGYPEPGFGQPGSIEPG